MNKSELKEKILSGKKQRIIICSKLGTGKTTFLKQLFIDANKCGLTPIFVDCSELNVRNKNSSSSNVKNSIYGYILSKYVGDISALEKTSDIALNNYLEQSFKKSRRRILLIIDSVEFLDNVAKENIINELKDINRIENISIVYSTHLIEDADKNAFAEYETINDFGTITEKEIIAHLTRHNVDTTLINASWLELLSTPFFLEKFLDTFDLKSFNFNIEAISKSEIIIDYITKYHTNNQSVKHHENARFIYTILPKIVFESPDNNIKLPNTLENYDLIKSLSFLTIQYVDRDTDELICLFTHHLYKCFFEAMFISNALNSKFVNLEECVDRLNSKWLDDQSLMFIGEQINLNDRNRDASRIRECLNWIQKNNTFVSERPEPTDSFLKKILEIIEENDEDLDRVKASTNYHMATRNSIATIILNCKNQLSEMNLSHLDLSLCNLSGVNCQQVDFSYSIMKDSCLIEEYIVEKPSCVAVSGNSEYVVLSESMINMNEYCYINIFNVEKSTLEHSFCLKNIIQLLEVDEEQFAIIRYENTDIVIDIYNYKNAILKRSCFLERSPSLFKPIGFHDNKFLFFLNKVLYIMDINSREVEEYAEFPLEKYNSVKLCTSQTVPNNNSLILYNNLESIDIFYIFLDDLYDKKFNNAYTLKIEKRNTKDKVYFSDKEPVVAVVSEEKTFFYNYKTINNPESDIDDYVNCSFIVCGRQIFVLGDELSETNPKIIDSSEGNYIFDKNNIVVYKNEKNYCFYNCKTKTYSYYKILKQDGVYWEKLDDDTLAIYSNTFKQNSGIGKRLIYKLDTSEFKFEHADTLPCCIDFNVLGNASTETSKASARIHSPFIRNYFAFYNQNERSSNYNEGFNLEIFGDIREILPYYSDKDRYIDFINRNVFLMPEFSKRKLLQYRKVNNSKTKFVFIKQKPLTEYVNSNNTNGGIENNKKSSSEIVIYDFETNHELCAFSIPDEVFFLNDSKLPNFLFQGELLCSETEQGYNVKMRNFEYEIDFSGKMLKRKVWDLNNYDSVFLAFYNTIKLIIISFLHNYYNSQYLSSTPMVFNSLERYLLGHGIKHITLRDPTINRYLSYISSMIYSVHTWSLAEIDYVFANLTAQVFVSNEGNIIYQKKGSHHLVTYGVMLETFYSYEWSTIISPNNYLKIADVTPSQKLLVINEPIFDLDISTANFTQVTGLSYYASSIIRKYGGIF